MNGNRPTTLPDYDQMVRLARDDPAGLEALRRALVEQVIASAPEETQAGLRDLQFRIDGIRITSPSPLIASQRMQRLMGESILQMQKELWQIVRLTCGMGRPPVARPAVPTQRPSFVQQENHRPDSHRPDSGFTDRL